MLNKFFVSRFTDPVLQYRVYNSTIYPRPAPLFLLARSINTIILFSIDLFFSLAFYGVCFSFFFLNLRVRFNSKKEKTPKHVIIFQIGDHNRC